jgi:predicted ATP-dependent endonuclease of OLD family
MRYKEFYFENFKGIEKMRLPLTGGVTTLIGLNESGKTTILEAIFCFSYGAENLDVINPGMASLRDPEQWIPISRRANFNDKITIQATVTLDDSDKNELRKYAKSQFGLSLSVIPDELIVKEEYEFENSRYSERMRYWNLSIAGTTGRQKTNRSYKANSPEWIGCVDLLSKRLPRIWYFPNFLFELPERFEVTEGTSSEHETADKNQFYRTTFENILTQLGYGATLQTHVVDRLKKADRADQRNLNALLLDMGRSITQTIFEGWNRIFGRAPAAQEVQIDAQLYEDDTAYLELKIKGPDGYYDLSERSLGFRWFFMFLLMTSFQGELNPCSKPLFLLDEPASNLHSSAQAELLKSFEKLLDRCSLIYTTHSHHLINVRWLDSAYVVKNAALNTSDLTDYLAVRVGARTSISAIKYRTFVAEHPDQTSYFQPVLELLDYRPSVLEPVPEVVLVEGKSDFYILRYVTEISGISSPLRLVPGGGAGSLDSLIRLHIGWGKSFLILLDGDAEGKKQLARYEKEFDLLIKDRCLLLPNLCGDPKIKEIEDVLSDADKRQIITHVHDGNPPGRVTKRALLLAVMELYARREPVTLDEETTQRFQHIVTQLEAKMNSQPNS